MKKVVCLFVLMFFVCFLSPNVFAIDATGTWKITESNAFINCLDATIETEIYTVIISQSGSTFIATRDGDSESGNIVDGKYVLYIEYPDQAYGKSGKTIEMWTFTFSSSILGSGTYNGLWSADDDSYSCGWGCEILMQKQGVPSPSVYDATGVWNFSSSGNYDSCGEETSPESGIVTISQSGNTFTITRDGDSLPGTINGATYSASGSFSEDGGTTTTTLIFTLSSATTGTGTGTWTWTDGYYNCNGGFNLSLSKSSSTPTYDATGTWSYSLYNSYNNCGEPNENDSGNFYLSQSGSTFTLTVNGDAFSGTINGNIYSATASYSEDGGLTTETVVITLDSSTYGNGDITWTWDDGSSSCSGGAELSIGKSSSSLPPSGEGGGGGGGCFISIL